MTRCFSPRPSRLVLACSLLAISALVTLTYLLRRQPHLVPRPWNLDGTQVWEWTRLRDDWKVPERLGIWWTQEEELESMEQVDEPEPTHEWDMTCHEAVEKDLRVALYDFTPFHEEVIGSVLSTLNDTRIQTDLYRVESTFRYGFPNILKTFFSTYDGQALLYWDWLWPKLRAGEYDALIMTSCDERWVHPQLLDILPTLTDIPIICVHHEMWSFDDHRTRLVNSAKAGKLSFFTLGEHVRRNVVEGNLQPWTEDGEDNFEWTDVPTEVFIPIFPLPESIALPSHLPKKVIPNDVAILGDVNSDGRRDYARFFVDLIAAIQANPSVWGYDISPETGYFIPSSHSSQAQPFRVHLFGGVEKGLQIPPELEEHVLVFRSGLDYVEYYRELSKLDLVLPIFGNDEYIKYRATAAFPAGVISRVPSLVTPSLLKSYNYLEPPAIILQPEGTSEVEVLAAMRRGEDPWSAIQQREYESNSDRDGYIRSLLLDSQLDNRPSLKHKEWDWDGYVNDVRAYNAKLMCKTLLL